MPTVSQILRAKGEQLHCIWPTATVLEATRKMNEHQIGALVVMHEGQVVGMFTERDVLRRVVAEQKPPSQITVGEVMTTEVICIRPDTDLEDASQIMKDKRVRHLPVCDDNGQLHGLISIGDLNAFYASNQEQTIHYLQEYIYGRG
jgi:CBS domain-containing protein